MELKLKEEKIKADAAFVTAAIEAEIKKNTSGSPLWQRVFGDKGKSINICGFCSKVIAHNRDITVVVKHIRDNNCSKFICNESTASLKKELLSLYTPTASAGVKKGPVNKQKSMLA